MSLPDRCVVLRLMTLPCLLMTLILLSQTTSAQSALVDRSWENISPPFTNGNSIMRNSAVALSDPNVVYVRYCKQLESKAEHALSKSIDGGKTWAISSSIIYDGASCIFDNTEFITVDPVDADTVYLVNNNNLEKSIDGGQSWNRLWEGNYPLIKSLAIDPVNRSTLYLGFSTIFAPDDPRFSIQKSIDGGVSWIASSSGITLEDAGQITVSTILIDTRDAGSIYVGLQWDGATTTARLFKSSDGGENWRLLRLPQVEEYSSIDSLAQSTSDPEVLYAVGRVQADQYKGPILRSTNQGEDWAVIGQAPSDSESTERYAGSLKLAIDPKNSNEIYIGSYDGVYRSSNGGASWSEISEGFQNISSRRRHITIECIGADGAIYATSNTLPAPYRELFKAQAILGIIDPACDDISSCNPKSLAIKRDF